MDSDDIRIASQKQALTTLRYLPRAAEQPTRPTAKLLSAVQMKQKETDRDMNGFAKGRDYCRYQRLSNICMVLVGLKVFLCFIYYELDHVAGVNTDWLLNMAFVVHCFIVGLRLVIESMRNERMQIIEKLSYSYHSEIFKILISLPLYPLPFLQNSAFDVNYSLTNLHQTHYSFKTNYLIIIPSIIDAVVVTIRTLILNTVYYSPRAQRVGKIYEIHHHGELYAIKCIVKDNPLSAFALMTIMMLLLSGFALRIVEGDVPIDGNAFYHYENCFWFVGITITTVGYGDMYPVSELGHIMVCFCCVWSCFNTSVITFLLVSNLSLKPSEQKSLQLLKNVDQTLSRKNICRQYIRITLYRLLLNKKYKLRFKESLKQKKLRGLLFKIRFEKKMALNVIDLAEEMEKQFDNALTNIGQLIHNNLKQLDYIAKTYFVSNKPTDSSPTLNINPMQTHSNLFKKDREDPKDSIQSMLSIDNNLKDDVLELWVSRERGSLKQLVDKNMTAPNSNAQVAQQSQDYMKLKQYLARSSNK